MIEVRRVHINRAVLRHERTSYLREVMWIREDSFVVYSSGTTLAEGWMIIASASDDDKEMEINFVAAKIGNMSIGNSQWSDDDWKRGVVAKVQTKQPLPDKLETMPNKYSEDGNITIADQIVFDAMWPVFVKLMRLRKKRVHRDEGEAVIQVRVKRNMYWVREDTVEDNRAEGWVIMLGTRDHGVTQVTFNNAEFIRDKHNGEWIEYGAASVVIGDVTSKNYEFPRELSPMFEDDEPPSMLDMVAYQGMWHEIVRMLHSGGPCGTASVR